MEIYRSKNGFTLVEIMIVVVIIGLLFAIAVPNYFKAGVTSKRNVCITNLKQIDTAISGWAIDNEVPAGTAPDQGQEDGIYSYIKGPKPVCPSGGTYTIYLVGVKPQVRCSHEASEDHKLPD
ncbi:MAG: prepilin-type N-terminal cleavage/methylation domain-containing protein [Candidatus Omnitrophota bacterium]